VVISWRGKSQNCSIRGTYKTLSLTYGKSRRKWEDNIKKNMEEVYCEDLNRMRSAVLRNEGGNIVGSKTKGNFMNRWITTLPDSYDSDLLGFGAV
jgi:hypothetical protein